MLAGETIEMAPPSLSFFPTKKSLLDSSKKRSVSTTALDQIKKEGGRGGGGALKAWWEKVSGRFRRLKSDNRDNRVSVNIIPDEPGGADGRGVADKAEGLNDGGGGSVFTLGFAAATTDLSSYAVSAPLAPPAATDPRQQRQQKQQQRQRQQQNRPQRRPSASGMPRGISQEDRLRRRRRRSKELKKEFSSSSSSSKGRQHRHRRGKSLTSPDPLPTKDHNSNHKRREKRDGGVCKDVASLLRGLSLQEYADVFAREEVDLAALRELSEGDLAEMGVASRDARVAILGAVRKMGPRP